MPHSSHASIAVSKGMNELKFIMEYSTFYQYMQVRLCIPVKKILDMSRYKICRWCKMHSPMAFAGCKSLEKIDIPSNVAEIGQGAFDGCSSITSIILPSSITKIEDYLFSC